MEVGVTDAVRAAGGKAELNDFNWFYMLSVLAAVVVPGAAMAFLNCLGAASSCDDTSAMLSGNGLLFICVASALFALFAVLMQHGGALQLREYNPTYHLFLQRLAILLLIVGTQLVLSAALLASEGEGLATPSGSVAFMLLVVALLQNGRLVLIFILYGLSRAKADLVALADTMRALGVLPQLKEEKRGEEAEEERVAIFPPMY